MGSIQRFLDLRSCHGLNRSKEPPAQLFLAYKNPSKRRKTRQQPRFESEIQVGALCFFSNEKGQCNKNEKEVKEEKPAYLAQTNKKSPHVESRNNH